MSKIMERSHELRAITERHYNCAQAVFVPFAEVEGMDHELAYRLALNFGGGLKNAATCGAIVGGLMVLGLYGLDDPATVKGFYNRMSENHNGMLTCKELLGAWFAAGNSAKKPHCDGMVYEVVALCEEILKEKGKID